MARLQDKVALVTGAASGIGEATARLFVAEGARVIIADKNEATGATVAQSLGDAARFAALDVTSPQSWRAAVRQARDAFGKLDILVNCAGYYARHTMLDTSEDDFERHIAVNQRGVLFGMQAAAEAMGAGGAIINIASTVGLRGGPNELSYRTTKWAVRGLTRSAAHDLAAAGIRVNAVLPGPVDTPMMAHGQTETARQAITERTLMKRLGRPREIANAVLFLASDEASFMTGAEVPVDGGALA
jgi:3alpha(or 20beta)-hydroxysteroid dehydrogenase